MKRRRVILLVGACVVIAVVAVAFWPGEKEPSYNGKTLFQWLDQYQPHTGSRMMIVIGPEAQRTTAETAVRCIGTNGLPCMLRWLRYYAEPDWRDRLARTYCDLPLSLQNGRLAAYLVGHSGQAHAAASLNGFQILGAEACSALPELLRMAAETNSTLMADRAFICVEVIRGTREWHGYEPRYGIPVGEPGLRVRTDYTNGTSTNGVGVSH